MAHFAELDENNIVKQVIVIPNEEENNAENFIHNELNLTGTWIKTSYNTRKGIYYTPNTNSPDPDQSKAFRKNYAGEGFFYDETRDAFISPKPFESWTLDEFSCIWQAPIPMPETEGPWKWDEDLQNWEQVIIVEPDHPGD